MMDLVKEIDLAPFAETQWRSEKARREWEPTLRAAGSAYNAAEIETVRRGMRACTTAHFRPENMIEGMTAYRDLVYVPIQRVGCYSGFAHRHPQVEEGKPWTFYGVVAKDATAAWAFVEATKRGDHRVMGGLLGYPQCCQDFFTEQWPLGYIDPVWQAAEKTEGAGTKDRIIVLPYTPAWTGLRYIGVRAVPHLPCSFSCPGTLKMAEQWLSLPGMEAVKRILELPCEWSVLKGIAIITTPYFRVVTNSVPCYPEYRVIHA